MADIDPLDPRVVLAVERTMLAWVRTGIAMMGFGFVVARFGVFLRELAAASGHASESRSNAAWVGVAIVAAGVAVNVWSSVRHFRILGSLARGDVGATRSRASGMVGLATGIGGAVLVALLLFTLRG